MPANNFYPSLSTLLSVDNIPDNMGFIEDGLLSVFNHLYYKDLQTDRSVAGEAAFYSVSLLTYRRLGIEIPGTDGMALVLNPDFVAGGTSEFPISLSYKWTILKYIRDFNIGNFDWSGLSFFKLLLDISEASSKELLWETIISFIDEEDPIQKFVDDFNTNHSPPTPLVKSSDPDELVVIADLIVQMQTNGNNYDVFEVIYEDYLKDEDENGDIYTKLESLFNKFLGSFTIDTIKDLLIPQVSASLNNLSLALEFPRSFLIPIDTDPGSPTFGQLLEEPAKSKVLFDIGSMHYSTENALEFKNESEVSFQKSQIGNTGITVSFNSMKLDLSRKKNIPEAEADGRPDDFVGVFVEEAEIGLPAFWNHDDGGSTAIIKGKNLLIGTGGLSGTIELAAKDGINPAPVINVNFGDKFEASLTTFSITFQQNVISASTITGKLKIPGFKDTLDNDAEIDIKVLIGQNGEFSVTASEADGIPLKIPGILTLIVRSVAIGKQNGKFYLETSGQIDFDEQGAVGKFIKDPIAIEKLRIWQDGSIDLQGGSLPLPKTASLKLGPANITITAIHLGSHEQTHQGKLRKYRYVGFDGGLSIKPGGIDARGDGIKLYFTVDNGPGRPLHVFFRIQSIAIDIVIPGSANKESAAVLLNGYLAMKEPNPSSPDPANGTEYIGGISFRLPKVKIGGSAAMRMNPKVPAFVVDVGLALPMPIPLGATGLGIYGFRGLFGQRYVADKQAAGLSSDAKWYEYYKAKVSPDFREGVQVSKFSNKKGFSAGAGVSFATTADSGKAFSSKLFIMINPTFFMLEGQAAILKERIGLDNTNDPPFYAMIMISEEGVEAAFGVNYQLPEKSGAILDVQALIELGFFFTNSSAWYINLGRDLPEDKRIRAKVFTLFNAYAYLMLSGQGIKAGAGTKYELKKHFGPLSFEVRAWMDISGRINFKPVQIGGSVDIGGSIYLRIFRFGIGLSVGVSMAAEAPKPFIISGTIEGCIKFPIKKRLCGRVDITISIDRNRDLTPLDLMNPSQGVKAVNMLSFESYSLYYSASGSSALPSPPGNLNQHYIIPLDSYIDLEFLKPVKPENDAASRYIIPTEGSDYLELSPPRKGKSLQVRHEYLVKNVKIFSRDNSGNWQEYHPYQALVPMPDLPLVNLTTLRNGAWQAIQPRKTNKLRILGTNPLSYMRQGGEVNTDDLNYQGGFITCAGESRLMTCVRPQEIGLTFNQDQKVVAKGVMFRMLGKDGEVIEVANNVGLNKGLKIPSGASLEIFFAESAAEIRMKVYTYASQLTVSYYKIEQDGFGISNLPKHVYTQISSQSYTSSQLLTALHYEDISEPVDKIVITHDGTCDEWDFLAQETVDLILQENLGHLVLEEGNSCNSFLFEVCYLKTTDYAYNNSIPAQSAVTAQNIAMEDAVNNTILPIWRPDTTYAIQVQETDRVEGTETLRYHNFIFRTAGPVGHFHQYRQEYASLQAKDREDEFKLASLKDYIDYSKSYPNADGNIINAKPLFYHDPVLALFYIHSYVYTMYNEFPAYNNLPSVDSDLEILIKDPAEPVSDDPEDPIVVIPSQKTWKINEFPVVSDDIQVLNYQFQEGNANCSGTGALQPVSVHTEITPLGLQPERLYTAILKSRYKGTLLEEIHRYVFQTSRYADFTEQIESYMLKDDTDTILRLAVYDVERTFTVNQLENATALINDTLDNQSLIREYADRFDRMVDGILRIGTIDPPVTTDFNLIRDIENNTIIGILVRNPEPFNDPKIPASDLSATIRMSWNNGDTSDHKVIFSKDRSKAFISNASMDIASGDLKFFFQYLTYNGRHYSVAESKIAEFAITL